MEKNKQKIVVQAKLKAHDHIRVKTASAIEGCTMERLAEKAILAYMELKHGKLIIAEIGGASEESVS